MDQKALLDRIKRAKDERWRSINLMSEGITELPPEIGTLENLQTLYLQNNKLFKLPEEILQLKKLGYLNLHGNPLSIPPEILDKVYDPAAILSSYFGKRSPLLEAKVIFVGQGSVGKTSLVNKLTKNTFNPRERKTEGIAIKQWQITDKNKILSI